mmetsp:Transcript_148161/g.283931  ORF Transcript_148161/g.283931 Transcript_148161/m.283931 type:complete len:291 (+) Transcript_148161:65-937(+)
MKMHHIIAVLVYMACVGHGRRVQPIYKEHLQSGSLSMSQKSSEILDDSPSLQPDGEPKQAGGWAKAKSTLNPYNYIASDWSYGNFREQVFTFPGRKPCQFSIILATLKTWAADAFVQLLQRQHTAAWSFDWGRSAAFILFGCLYIGVVQWFLCVSILTSLFPEAAIFANEPWSEKLHDRIGQEEWVGQVFVSVFIFSVFFYFPAFYIIKAMVQESTSVKCRIHSALSKYWKNIVTDNLCGASVWIIADLAIYAQPIYLRMPLAHMISFGWTMFISFLRGANYTPEAKSET